MKLNNPTSRTWASPSKIVGIAAFLCCFYYVLYVFWEPIGRRGVWKEVGGEMLSGLKVDEGVWVKDIENATLGFQKLLVVNMPSRTDRRDATTLAFATSNITIEFINGVSGDSVPEEALPPGDSEKSIKLSKGIKGSWRSHMNALQQIVQQNLTTAMIFEDDVDWDVRLRQQLKPFAIASRLLSSPNLSSELGKYDVQVSKNPETEESIHNDTSSNPIAVDLYSLPIDSALHSIPRTSDNTSPYGDTSNWDVLWLGHCGAGFPRYESSLQYPNSANLILTTPTDPTVPSPKHLRAHPFGPLDALSTSHPPHTRVYHRGSGGALCTIAYAVSQRGARRLLAEFGVKRWGKIWDAELGEWCAGASSKVQERVCLTVQPPIFAHHHPAGGQSNIGGLGGGYAREVETKYVRWSVRMNLDKLISGAKEEDLVDQWPDGEEIVGN